MSNTASNLEAAPINQEKDAPFCPDRLEYAAALIRELRWAVLFAQSELEYFAALECDPDTGKISPARNGRPANSVWSLFYHIEEDPAAMYLLKEPGWTQDTFSADWNTMLAHLPILITEPPYLPLDRRVSPSSLSSES